MKKTFAILAVALSMVACNSKPDTTKSLTTTDTTGDYLRRLADTPIVVQTQPVGEDTIMTSNGEQYVKVDPNTAAAAAATTNKVKSTSTKRSTSGSSTKRSTARSSSGSGTSSSSGPGTSTTQTQKKEGWSSAAKGAVIGGASGAVTGAIISKKKGKGAIIGGVVGATGGYIIGRSKDKKSGRVE